MSDEPKRNKVEVKSDEGNFLFLYIVDRHMVEIHRRGIVYQIPLLDLIEFGRTSERKTFRVMPTAPYSDTDSDIVRQGFE